MEIINILTPFPNEIGDWLIISDSEIRSSDTFLSGNRIRVANTISNGFIYTGGESIRYTIKESRKIIASSKLIDDIPLIRKSELIKDNIWGEEEMKIMFNSGFNKAYWKYQYDDDISQPNFEEILSSLKILSPKSYKISLELESRNVNYVNIDAEGFVKILSIK